MDANALLKLIRSGSEGREKAARFLYTDMRLRNGVKKVMGFGQSNENDFWDIYHTMIIQFFKYIVKNKDFTLGQGYHNYLIKAGQNLWYMELRRRKRRESNLPEKFDIPDVDSEAIDVTLESEDIRSVIHRVLELVGINCKAVLLKWAQGLKMDEIKIELNYDSVEAVRKRKFDCLKRIAKYLDNHPEVKLLLK